MRITITCTIAPCWMRSITDSIASKQTYSWSTVNCWWRITQLELRSERTLQALYLEPLKKRIDAHGGRVFRDGPTFSLLIDIKSEAEATYQALHEVLAKYSSILTTTEGDQVTPGAVTIAISGNRPQSTIAAQKRRYCGIDGRLSDLDSTWPAHLLPMISDNWTNHFKWRGRDEMPPAERDKLLDIVQRAHAKGRVVRFWATPEEPALWKVLVEADVDLINTDRLAELESFLR